MVNEIFRYRTRRFEFNEGTDILLSPEPQCMIKFFERIHNNNWTYITPYLYDNYNALIGYEDDKYRKIILRFPSEEEKIRFVLTEL